MVQLPDLPTEILDNILSNLGPFDNGELKETKDVIDHFDEYRASLKSVAGLCRTCKALQRVARPILYRFPLAYDVGAISLTRTLATREDLKARVQGLVIKLAPSGEEKQELVISPDDQDLFNNLMAKYPTRANGELINIPSTWATADENSKEFTGHPKRIMTALILTQIPNAERISIDMSSGADLPFCQPGSLPRLVELDARYCGKSCFDMMRLDGVLKAAPALKTLNTVNIFMVEESEGVSHDNITALDLTDSALEVGSFKKIMEGFPKLERLFLRPSKAVVVSTSKALSAYQILRTLPIRADTLRHIHLFIRPMEWEGGLYEALIPSLKGMTSLETLYIDYANMYTDETITSLVGFLPPSIRSYEQDYTIPTMVSAMLNLAESAPEKFPNLKKVSFGKFYDDDDDSTPAVEKAFQERGIECVLEPDTDSEDEDDGDDS
ncbi:hypothetical protein N0V84_006639 [Fusarium piperis]|uniref:F-box domain-containing protein n=1 Tax=Fusarium piperis TaxID=1435070 RepID=A0A9W8WBE6_9HYPO|nr:hypothetical protein N0V84_006639 [Fusarium piperis]